MDDDIERVLFDEASIAARVRELAEEITRDVGDDPPLLVGILKGSFVFLADLVRAMDMRVDVDFMAVSSYGDKTKSSGVVRTLKDLDRSIAGRRVIIVEDIVDTGLTLRYLLENLETRKPASLAVCTLLDKPGARRESVEPTYVGFTCPELFVVGYGLDYRGRYRNLPYIGLLAERVYADT
jgi:hypoxanthine phosphoribosyltransferase